MKLAGLTWWRGNYGSILQAYALLQVMNGIDGVDYEILDQYGALTSGTSLMERLHSMGLRKTLHKIRWKFMSKGFRQRNRAILNFVNNEIRLSKKRYTKENIAEANQVYDGFICGSDQIWNPIETSLEDIYWLGFAEEGKLKIAYAPSIGVKAVSEEQRRIIRNNLESFTAVSCRESQGTRLINQIMVDTGICCEDVLDPVFLIPVEHWSSLSSESNREGYVFAYILRGNKEQRKLVDRFAKAHKLPVVTLPFLDSDYIVKYDKKFGDERLYDVSPPQLIQLIENAEYVFTDSFHCSVFSILYHRNFFILPKIGNSQMTRLRDLQDKFQIKNRIIDSDTTNEQIDSMEQINWELVEKCLKKLREESYAYLEEALKND